MKMFDNAELELIAFEAEDVISTSGEYPYNPVPEDDMDDGFNVTPPDLAWHNKYHKLFPVLGCKYCCNKK